MQKAEQKLANAIKAGDIDTIGISHRLLEVARKRMDGATAELCDIATKRKKMTETDKANLMLLSVPPENKLKLHPATNNLNSAPRLLLIEIIQTLLLYRQY